MGAREAYSIFTGAPYRGYEKNVMGRRGQYGVKRENLAQIIKHNATVTKASHGGVQNAPGDYTYEDKK